MKRIESMMRFRKLFCIFFILISLSLAINATDDISYIYNYPEQNITIEFQSDTSFTEDTRLMIADVIINDTPLAQTYSLCWLVGHDITVERVSAIYHKRSEYAPRCQWEIYDVEKCSNCDYTYARLIDSCYISCCPPDASAVSIDDSHTH